MAQKSFTIPCSTCAVAHMIPTKTIDWYKLSKQAVHDQDPAKLEIMIDEINLVMGDKSTLEIVAPVRA